MVEIATPDLYRVNAFRVLGLSVDVSSSDLSKQQKKMKMLEKLGEGAAHSQLAVLPLGPPPDVDSIRKAGQQLRDPELRLVHEIFWFWPVDTAHGEDLGLRMLRAKDTAAAASYWMERQNTDACRSVATHNLAVLNHLMALDIEQTSPPDCLGQEMRQWRDSYWEKALTNWQAVAEDEGIWSRVAFRMRKLDDPRLTSGLARRLRRTLPSTLITISIRLAVSSAKRGDAGDARRHLAYVRNSDLDAGLAAKLLEREVAPLIDQVKQICDPVPEMSKADPKHADLLVEPLWTEIKPLLTIICALLDKRHHLREKAFDVAADTLRNCIIDYGITTENWERCAALLKQVVKIAPDKGLRARLQEDITQVETKLRQEREYETLKNAVTGNQVYDVTLAKGSACQELAQKLGVLKVPGEGDGFRATVPGGCACCLGKPDGEQSVSHEWEETRGLTRYKRTLSFAFPVCGECRQHQAEYSRKRWLLVVLAAGASTGIVYLVAAQMDAAEWLPFVLVGGLLTAIMLLVCSSFIRLSILADEHACRDVAVEMSSASDVHVTFGFHNPLYADAFAKANHATVKSHSYTKPPRGSYLLRGRAVIFAVLASLILGGIGHSILYAVIQDEWKRKSSVTHQDYAPRATENRRSTPPSDIYSPARPSPSRYRYTGLSARIDSGKARAKAMESEIGRMDTEMETLSSVLRVYKEQIDNYERQARLGQRVDTAAYELAISNHNVTVRQYNSLLTEQKAKYAECSREKGSVKDMVRRFNSGER